MILINHIYHLPIMQVFPTPLPESFVELSVLWRVSMLCILIMWLLQLVGLQLWSVAGI